MKQQCGIASYLVGLGRVGPLRTATVAQIGTRRRPAALLGGSDAWTPQRLAVPRLGIESKQGLPQEGHARVGRQPGAAGGPRGQAGGKVGGVTRRKRGEV